MVHADHIGSTAIPCMAAKDILDLQLSVRDLPEAVAAFDEPLAALGFARSRYQHDHVPAGSGSDPDLWRKRLWSRRQHAGDDVNLHVRLVGSPNERLALLFRDFLRAHPRSVPAYAEFKLALLAAVSGNLGTYSKVKDPMVDLVISRTEPWAAATDWRSHAR